MEFKRDNVIALHFWLENHRWLSLEPSSILLLITLLVIEILAVLYRVQKVGEKNAGNTRNDPKSKGHI